MVVSLPRQLDAAVDLALVAGARIMAYYRQPCDAAQKGAAGPVTAADLAAHTEILAGLERIDPGTPVISEEGEIPPFEARRGWRRFWLIDPLDGTKEFLAANGEFTVNMALIEAGVPVLGVIAAPALKTVYFAARGCGSWTRAGEGITTRLTGVTHDPGPVTRVVESRSHPSPELERFIASLGPVQRTPLGSSLKFCRVAEGAADVYPRFGTTMEWDVAAGDAIYRQAGCGDRERSSPLVYNQPSLATRAFVIGQCRRLHGPPASA